MSKESRSNPDDKGIVETTCTCCGTWLKVDVATGAVLAEKRPRQPMKTFEDALAAEKQRSGNIDSAFRKAFTHVEHEKDILEKKLQEAMKKAREEKDKPLPPRPIDLD